MNQSQGILHVRDLTGQIVLQDRMPEFMGNYSCVFKGLLGTTLVAVKVIKAIGEHRVVYRKVARERTVWASLMHKNIHPFLGFAEDQEFAPFGALISRWCGRGDADQFLREHGTQMKVEERFELWKGFVDGVAYLHLHTPMVVHGDLKPGNVLIDEFNVPKLCDFGLCRIFHDEESTGMTTTSEHTGTERYLAPELVQSQAMYPTTASDVYAVGCLGLEFLYLQKPYSHRKHNLRGGIITDLKTGVPPATRLAHHSPSAWRLLSFAGTQCHRCEFLPQPSPCN